MKPLETEEPTNGEPQELAEEAPGEEAVSRPVPADDGEASARRVHWKDFVAICVALDIEPPERPPWLSKGAVRVEATGVATDRGYLYMVRCGKKGRHVFVR